MKRPHTGLFLGTLGLAGALGLQERSMVCWLCRLGWAEHHLQNPLLLSQEEEGSSLEVVRCKDCFSPHPQQPLQFFPCKLCGDNEMLYILPKSLHTHSTYVT